MRSLRTRLFHIYARLRRPMTLGVRAIVENADGEILLVRHTYISGWHLPGGGVERGETCETALRKEVLEEGGIILTGTPSLEGVYSNHRVFKNDHVLMYRIRKNDWQQGKATAFREIAESGWFSLSDLPEGTTPATRLRLAETYHQATRSQFWPAQKA